MSADPANLSGFRKGLTSYGDPAFSLFLRNAFIKGAGYTDDALARPIVGIVNTGSGFNPCHGNATELIAAVRRGVMLAGGLPIEFPTISIHESFAHPTSMFLRNLMAMDTEEMIRAQPMDAVVLIGDCGRDDREAAHTREDHHRQIDRKCIARIARHRWFDERDYSPDRHRWAARHRDRSGRGGCDEPRDAGARGSETLGPALHGRLSP